MRKVGLSAFDDKRLIQNEYSTLAQTLVSKKQQELSTQFQLFKSILLNFLKEHNNDLSSDLNLRNEFVRICSLVGIDPLSVYQDSGVNMNEFYYELCVRLIEFSNTTRDFNGGLLPVEEFLSKYKTLGITFKDIEMVIEMIQTNLNKEFKLIKIGKLFYLKNCKIEITNDQNKVMEIVNDIGYISLRVLRDNLNWNKIKCKDVINEMVKNGHLWVDEQGPGKEILYWDPGWINRV